MSTLNSPRLLQTPIWPYQINHLSEQARGLVAWWPMALGGGNRLADLRTPLRTGAISGAVWRGDEQGASLFFDGTDDLVDCGTSFNLSGAVTLGAWIYPTLINSVTRAVMGQGTVGATVAKIQLSDTNKAGFFASGGGGVLGATTLSANRWYLVVITRTAADAVVVYLNGAADGSGTSGAITSDGDVVLGASFPISGPSQWYQGLMRDARIYNRALSAADVWALYDPQTRYDLYWSPWMAGVGGAPAAPVTGARNGDFNISLA